jgi:aminotransferase
MLAEGVLVPVPTAREDSFEVRPEELEKVITPNTKGIILISPSNPTGGIIRQKTLEQIAQIAQKHDLLVISDELYERYLYDDYQHFSIGSLPGMWERTVTINGFSKCYGMTGWRVGYVTAPSAIIKAMLPIHHGMNICAPAVSQWAALAALKGPHDWFDDILKEYSRRRQLWMRNLDEMGLPYGEPQGAYYIIFDAVSTGLASQQFAEAARAEAQVVVGGGVGATGPAYQHLNRGSFAVPTDRIEEGLARLKPLVSRYQAQ